MDFNIRAISLADSVAADARLIVSEQLGRDVTFRAGISISIKLPDALDRFRALPEPERILTALDSWSRVYRYPDGEDEVIKIIAVADHIAEEVLFYRIDLRQPPARPRRGPRPAVEIIGGAVMTYDQCAGWLIELSHELAANKDKAQRPVILPRPRLLKPKQIRIAWVGPEVVDSVAMPMRLRAIGQVYGAEILHVPPRSYRDVTARIAGASPLDAAIICSHFAPYITVDAVPKNVCRERVHLCGSTSRSEMEQQVRSWIEVVTAEVETERHDQAADENQMLLNIMLRGMLSHSKIGQFKHCQKATVLKGVRARHLNVANAERILNENRELFQDTKSSTALFLWKEHNDGPQYFLNPQKVEEAKAMVSR